MRDEFMPWFVGFTFAALVIVAILAIAFGHGDQGGPVNDDTGNNTGRNTYILNGP